MNDAVDRAKPLRWREPTKSYFEHSPRSSVQLPPGAIALQDASSDVVKPCNKPTKSLTMGLCLRN